MENSADKAHDPRHVLPVNMEELHHRTMGDVELMQMLFDELKSTIWPLMDDVRSALESGDMDKLEKEAHQLKGAAASLAVKGVAAKAYDLELMGKGAIELTDNAIDDLQNEIQKFIDFIEHYNWEQ